jgi:hypothetical protein
MEGVARTQVYWQLDDDLFGGSSFNRMRVLDLPINLNKAKRRRRKKWLPCNGYLAHPFAKLSISPTLAPSTDVF